MTELTPEKIKELTSLMANAPPATAARLLAMFERMKIMGNQVIPSNDLISAMREAGGRFSDCSRLDIRVLPRSRSPQV